MEKRHDVFTNENKPIVEKYKNLRIVNYIGAKYNAREVLDFVNKGFGFVIILNGHSYSITIGQ